VTYLANTIRTEAEYDMSSSRLSTLEPGRDLCPAGRGRRVLPAAVYVLLVTGLKSFQEVSWPAWRHRHQPPRGAAHHRGAQQHGRQLHRRVECADGRRAAAALPTLLIYIFLGRYFMRGCWLDH